MEILERIKDTKLVWEILIVDDCSTDGTRDILKEMDGKENVRVILKDRNEGKGSAVTIGMREDRGDILLIQDADLEYDPRDYPTLLKPLEEGIAEIRLARARSPGRCALDSPIRRQCN